MSESKEEMRDRLRRLDASLVSAAEREQLAIAGLHERKAALIRAEVDHAASQREHRKLVLERLELSNKLHMLSHPAN